MSSFLEKELNKLPSYTIIKNDGHIKKEIKINIYNDDTILELLNKIAIKEGLDYKYIFAWLQDSNDEIIPISFICDFSLKDPFKLKEFFNRNYIDEDGTRISSSFESLYHTIIHNVIKKNEINYCTIYDYLKYHKIKNELNDDEIRNILKVDPKLFFIGNLQLYWKDLTKEDIRSVKESKYLKRFKEVKELTERQDEIVGLFNQDLGNKMRYSDDFQPIVLMISNDNDKANEYNLNEYNLNIIKLFTDFHLCDMKNHQIVFSKLFLDERYNSYYKINKDKISVRKDDDKLMNEDRFTRWTKGIVTSVPNVSMNYLNFKNTLSYKVIDKNNTYFTMMFSETGSVRCIFERTGEKILTREYISEKINFVNHFLKEIINNEKIYHNYELGNIPSLKKELYGEIDKGITLLSGHLYYDIKDYRKETFEYVFSNLSVYTRFNKSHENWIYGIYKRVNNYDSIDTKMLVISKFAQEYDDKKIIISLISEYFGIIEEDASDEYDNWLETRESGNFKTENGIDFIVEGVKSSHIRISIGECSNYDEFRRIYNFFNVLMSVYYEYTENNKDIFNIFSNNKKKKKEKVIYEDVMSSIENEMISSELQEGLDEGIEEVINKSKKSQTEDSDFSELSDNSNSANSENLKLSDMSEKSEGDSSLSEEFSMDLLDDSESSNSSSGGGTKRIVGGGFDIRSYYLNRMTKNPRYDNDLFDFETGKVHKSSKSGEQKYTYARTCGAHLGRQPVAVTETELERIKNDPEHGEGLGYSKAIKVPNREPVNGEDIYYICPKYWDVKNEIPKNPLLIEGFKENVAGMDYSSGDGISVNLKAKDKMNSEKYILIRNEGDYWNNAGDDINRYNIELIDNFHPNGYGLPCCNMPRLEKISKKDKVEIYVQKDRKKEWYEGTVIELGTDGKPTKKNPLKPYKVILKESDKVYEVFRKDIRKKRSSSYISNYVPCNIGQQCHISQIIKNFFGLPKDSPSLNSGNTGLIRKGIKQTNSSFITSLALSIKNSATESSQNELIQEIIYDVKNHPLIYELGNGTFINRFKGDIYKILDEDIPGFLKFVKDKKLKRSHYDKYLKGGDKKRFLNGPKNYSRMVLHYYNEYSSVLNLERYLRDDKFVISDTLLVSLLISISKMKDSKTFYLRNKKNKKKDKNLGIFIFEEIIDKIKISIPDGDLNIDFDECLLFFKKGSIYEPIFFRYTDRDYSFINESVEKLPEKRINIMNIIKEFILEKNVKKNESVKNIVNAIECIEIMKHKNKEIISLIYDDYYKIRYIETDKNVFIPVKPTSLEKLVGYKKTYIGNRILDKNYPIYNDVIEILEILDTEIDEQKYNKFLGDKTGISTRGEWIKRNGENYYQIWVIEIIVNNVSYIPIQKEEYMRKKHMDIISLNSLYDCDKSLILSSETNDDRKIYIQKDTYEKNFINQLYRKLYIAIINNNVLKENISEIKNHNIKLDIHKKLEIYPMIEELAKNIIKITEKEFVYGCPLVEDDRILYYSELNNEIKSIEVILKYFVVLLINYSENDYDRFIKIETDITRLSETLNRNELLFSYEQYLDEEYLDYFNSKSEYVNPYNLYDEQISSRSLSKIYGKRNKFKPVSFDKKYPKIVGEVIHNKSVLIKHQLLDITNIDIVLYSMNEEFDKRTKEKLLYEMSECIHKNDKKEWILGESELTVKELYEKYLGNKYDEIGDIIEDINKENHEITVPDLFIISYITKKAFVLISSLYSKLISHDIFIIITPDSLKSDIKETEILSFYQNKNYLANIMIGSLFEYPIVNLSEKFNKELRKKYRKLYDLLF